MLAKSLIERFEANAPISVMVRATLENILAPKRLDELYTGLGHSQEGNALLFSTTAEIMGLVAANVRGSVHAAYQAQVEEIGVTVKAVYDKLQRIGPDVSRTLVRELSLDMAAIIDQTKALLPPLLPGYQAKILDGNHLRRTERRLGVLREENVAPLPGHALVVLDPQRKLVIDVFPCEDGHAQERSLLPQVEQTVQEGDLWIGDRNFCTLGFLSGIANRAACFVIRRHATMPITVLESQAAKGQCATGKLREDKAEIVDAAGKVHSLRVITVKLQRATRDGDKEIQILTNLPRRITAGEIAELYSKRWSIETAFQEVALNLEGEIKTLGYPKAALFGFCMALVVYNVLSVVRSALRAAHGVDAVEKSVSLYYLADEVAYTHRGLTIAIPDAYWKDNYASLTPAELAHELIRIAKQARIARYRKHQRGPKKPVKPMNKKRRNHVSTAKLLGRKNHAA